MIWRYAAIQGYENLTLRIIASLICLPLIFAQHWPKKIVKLLPVYWYFAVTFCLPFFFTFMTIMNQWSVVWLLNLILALLLIFILLDFAGLCLTVFIGAGAAFLCFAYFSPVPLTFNPGSINLAGTLATLIAALVVGGVFARNREIIVAERMRRKSEAANKAKTEFIANMSHDIRTPITGIVGLVQDLLNKAEKTKTHIKSSSTPGALCSKTDELLEEVINLIQKDGELLIGATDELLQLCNEILETINLESGETSEKEESFNIRELIQQNVELFHPVAKNKNLNLSANIDEHVPTYLYGLRKYLYRCILNLISNALKFTSSGFVKINANARKSNNNLIFLKVVVEDSGVGIPKDKFDVIFEHFSRLTPSFEGIYKGSGLGLYTVKQYVNAMQGKIDVDSELGKGTKFILELPLSVSDHSDYKPDSIRLPTIPEKINELEVLEGNSEPKKPPESDFSGEVLIVEDHALAAVAVKAALDPFNCHIERAENGAQAVKMAEEGHYDLILMDIGLPDFSGIEVTKKIRALNNIEKSQVPIVALTGHANNPEMRQEALEAGMQDIISKPAQPLALESILQKFVFKTEEKEPELHETEVAPNDITEELNIIDWGACVRMLNGDPGFTRKMLSMMDEDLNNVKRVLSEAYAKRDTKALREELHRFRGGVCYLKLPELEYTLEKFHEAVKEIPQDESRLEQTYTALQNAIENFKLAWRNYSN